MSDILKDAAEFYRILTNHHYKFTLGYKGTSKEIILRCKDENFPHLLGLDKLKDIRQVVFKEIVDDLSKEYIKRKGKHKRKQKRKKKSNQGKEMVIKRIESNDLTLEDLEKSTHFQYVDKDIPFSIEDRIKYFPYIKILFESVDHVVNRDEVYFTFFRKKVFSNIDAEYLIRVTIVDCKGNNIYLNFF